MIVVCTACAAKFKVADEKVGARGAKLRCSKCQTVFLVRRDEPADAVAALEAAPPPASAPPPLPVSSPPPLPRRASTMASLPGADAPPPSPELGAPVDARSAFEIDLEPAAPRAAADFDPFAPAPPDDPFGPLAASPEPSPPLPALADPFGMGSEVAPDPFAAVQAPIPPELLHAPPPAAAAAPSDDPFAVTLPPLGGGFGQGGDLALEDRTTPPPRSARPQSSAPLDDPFGAPDEGGQADFGGGHPGDIPPMSHEVPGEPFGGYAAAPAFDAPPALTPQPRREAPLHVDPFAAAAVDADPIQVAPPAGRAAAAPAPPASIALEEALPPPGASQTLARLRSAAINAVSLLALLVVAMALLVVWRGNVPLSEAIHPAVLLSALTHPDGPKVAFDARHVTSGLYERARGAPLLYVRGEVVSHSPAAVAGVVVAVELVRGGAVVARGVARAGGLLSPEELYGAADAEALQRAAAAAADRAPAEVMPGQALPFLVALLEYPADLEGLALRVKADGEGKR